MGPPEYIVAQSYDNIVKLETHSGPINPFLEANRDLITALEFEVYYDRFRTRPEKGVAGFYLSTEFIRNLEVKWK